VKRVPDTLAQPVRPYDRQLTEAEISCGSHREFVGGMWDQIGRLQFDFMVQRGLSPSCRLLDIGCGALRGGLHFIRYLDPGNYFGIDANASLIWAGREVELPAAGLAGRSPHLLVDDSFGFREFEATFQFAIAQSLFTHLPANAIERCLVRIAEVLDPGGRFYATYFESPSAHHIDPMEHSGGIVTYSDADPFHYHFSLIRFLTIGMPLSVSNLGAWNHPRSQHMLEFVRT
jgi:SAM-dependent methyltransferase